MSTNVPVISVTTDFGRGTQIEQHSILPSSDSEESNSCDRTCNLTLEDLTDFENVDGYTHTSKTSLIVPKNTCNSLSDNTDVEDYNDSDPGEEDSIGYPELKLSTEDFLQYDFQYSLSAVSGVKEIVKHKSGNFLENLNTLDDYSTDCEVYSTDSEAGKNNAKSACFDMEEILIEQGDVVIQDLIEKNQNLEYSNYEGDNVSIVSDISSTEMALYGKEQQAMSEEETFELSNDAEIYHSGSDSLSNPGSISDEDLLSSTSFPPIDITFFPTNSIQSNAQAISKNIFIDERLFLNVVANGKAEVLTDTERFDDSVAEGEDSFDEDEGNQYAIPQAVIQPIDDDGECITDYEDFPCDDIFASAISCQDSALCVDIHAIPLPQREVVLLQEDKFGDTTTSVMPMDKAYQFGFYISSRDECLTDIEEYSCNDDLFTHAALGNLPSRSPSPISHNVINEPDITVTNELLKVQQSKRLEIISNAESITDVEEIYMAGTNSRKKKVKSRTASKTKSKFLEAPKTYTTKDDGGIDLNETCLPATFKYTKEVTRNCSLINFNTEKVTDVEDITVDDVSSVSEGENHLTDIVTSKLKINDLKSKNVVVTLKCCASSNCSDHTNNGNLSNYELLKKAHNKNNNSMQEHETDTENIQVAAVTNECISVSGSIVDCLIHEFNEMLNESYTTVHEKCSNSFNIDAEKLHIKGVQRDSLTDTEYVESDESTARGGK